ncbi:MAG: DUF1214 domain-containing protein [Halieaceae bacterium]|uniref:DUF1214 domain-containing protein n=1 Tax=Haliea alexandrii TaxID=2448162 RepID=UPI000F0B9410|nr:DUF1214 domain-containing protein [Haliea alexandrii]MCR9184039.1 DUF1214 domain-containing protein [Halieaceae bacterium]
MFGDHPKDAELKATWDAFCDKLKESSDLVFRDTTPASEIDRAKGLRLLARNISLGLQFNLDNCDADFPEIMHYFDPIRKQGGDNTDAYYSGAPINGKNTYRVTGKRGTARFFAITVLENGNTPWGGGVTGNLIDSDVLVDKEGNFEVTVSPEPDPGNRGNWIQTTPNAWRITFRQFFADWENEEPMKARIDRINELEHDPMLSAADVARGLGGAADWVRSSTAYWAGMLDKWKTQPNTFLSYGQLEDNKIDFTPGGAPLISYWFLPRDEAIVVRVRPPEADYWAVEFGNYWWETMDYRNRLSNTNCHYAHMEDDGELILVIAHEDTGHPNWLDPSGHEEGYVTVRWIGADHYPVPAATQMKLQDLDTYLPKGGKRLTRAERKEQIAERRRGVLNRFGF